MLCYLILQDPLGRNPIGVRQTNDRKKNTLIFYLSYWEESSGNQRYCDILYT